jgi:hypothetical protein
MPSTLEGVDGVGGGDYTGEEEGKEIDVSARNFVIIQGISKVYDLFQKSKTCLFKCLAPDHKSLRYKHCPILL